MKSRQTPSARASAPASNHSVVTINMVAQAAGVSLSTVSRVLSGAVAVSESKRRAVKEAVAKLNYVPSPVARSLASGRSMTIGVVTQALDSPFYGLALRGIEDELDPAGYQPLFVSGRWDAHEECRCIETLQARRVDGIIVLTGRISNQSLTAAAGRSPIVAVGRSLKAPGVFSMSIDNFSGALTATQFLIQCGHKNIAFICGDNHQPSARERLRGYRTALEGSGIAYNPDLVVGGDFNESSGMMAIDHLLASRTSFSAVFAANDQMAYGAALRLRRQGLRIPDDISLVGFDDLPGSSYVNPPLTSVRQPAYDIGHLSARAMMQMLRGETPQQKIPPLALTIRESTRRLSGG